MKKLFSFLLLLTCSGVLTSVAQDRFTREQLSADVDTLYSYLYQCHPNLFETLPQAEFEQGLEQIRGQLADSMTVTDLYQLVTPLVARLGDGHTFINFPIDNYFMENARLMPYSFTINGADTTLFVEYDLSGRPDPIPAGAQILSINGQTPRRIIEKLLPNESGESDAYKIEMIAFMFGVYYTQLDTATVFDIRYRHQGQTRTVRQPAISTQTYAERRGEIAPPENELPLRLTIEPENNLAVIDFTAFHFGPEGALRAFLDSTFQLLQQQNIGNLIIDIRKNQGGNSDVGNEIFQYISPVPFRQFGSVFFKYGEPYVRAYPEITAQPGSTARMEITEKDYYPLRENPYRYNGNIYLLTSSMTFSSAQNFSRAFDYFDMGTIVGEETGGWIVQYGEIFRFRLPNTELPCAVSVKKFYGIGADDSHRHGVRPDYPVPAAKAMDKARELIGKQ